MINCLMMGTYHLFFKISGLGAVCPFRNNAKESAVLQLQELYQKAVTDVGEENAMIFEIHQMMLEDLDYLEW